MKTKGFVLGSLIFVLMDDGDGVSMMVRQGQSVWPLMAFKYESADALAHELSEFVGDRGQQG
jgi:hypothetical protein